MPLFPSKEAFLQHTWFFQKKMSTGQRGNVFYRCQIKCTEKMKTSKIEYIFIF